MVSSRNRRFGAGGIRRQIRSRRAGGLDVPQTLSQPLVRWWRTNEGWDGTSWTDKVVGSVADGTGHAPTTATLNIDHTVLQFNGSSQYLTCDAATAALLDGGDYSIAIAYRTRVGVSSAVLFSSSLDGSTNHYAAIMHSNGGKDFLHRHRDTATNSAVLNSGKLYGGYGYSIAAFDYAGNTVDGYSNGNQDTGNAQAGDPTGMDIATIGALKRSVVDSFFTGDIAEICIFSGKLAAADAAAMEEYFNARYDVWRKIEKLFDYAWDPRRGTTIGTGVSAWEDQIGGLSTSQSTGSKQPTFTPVGLCASGAPALSFANASSQLLHSSILSAVGNSEQFTNYDACRYTALPTEATVSGWGRSVSSTVASRHRTTGVGSYSWYSFDGSTSNVLTAGTLLTGTDYWQYGASGSSTDRAARYRGVSEATSAVSIDQTALDTYAHGARKGSSEGQFFDGDLYANCVSAHKFSPAEHALAQSYFDDLMGL